MGNLCSADKKPEDGTAAAGSDTTSATAAVTPATNVEEKAAANRREQLRKIAREWRDDLRGILGRELVRLPIGKDLPRLAKAVRVRVDNEVVYEGVAASGNQPSKKAKKGGAQRKDCLAIIVALASALDSKKTVKRIKREFNEAVADGDSDLAGQLQSFVEAHLGDTNCVHVLKAMTQQSIFPPHYFIQSTLQEKMGEDFRYKDQSGHWSIDVYIDEQRVQVLHTRKVGNEGMGDVDDEDVFSFDWQLSVKLLRGEKFPSKVTDIAVGIPKDGLNIPNTVYEAHTLRTTLKKLHDPKCAAPGQSLRVQSNISAQKTAVRDAKQKKKRATKTGNVAELDAEQAKEQFVAKAKCPVSSCGFVFPTVGLYFEHAAEYHQEVPVSKRAPIIIYDPRHKHGLDKKLKCPVRNCGFLFDTEALYEEHYKEFHKELKKQAPAVVLSHAAKRGGGAVGAAAAAADDDIDFVCPDGACGFHFKSEELLLQHLNDFHEELAEALRKEEEERLKEISGVGSAASADNSPALAPKREKKKAKKSAEAAKATQAADEEDDTADHAEDEEQAEAVPKKKKKKKAKK